MDIIYRLQGAEFEWDADKAKSNIQKHDVTFEELPKFSLTRSIRQAMRRRMI
jgi:uncharacterized DUF497 family protein